MGFCERKLSFEPLVVRFFSFSFSFKLGKEHGTTGNFFLFWWAMTSFERTRRSVHSEVLQFFVLNNEESWAKWNTNLEKNWMARRRTYAASYPHGHLIELKLFFFFLFFFT